VWWYGELFGMWVVLERVERKRQKQRSFFHLWFEVVVPKEMFLKLSLLQVLGGTGMYEGVLQKAQKKV